ncbi:unnamed protein product [Candida verbasci]|uniref:Uncharacterized protein n=1 Tax=Candida verbasci TaxID=1227364 RepID=A0A9W4TX95_9ASCO|nr:unnamed protein product [Candida verbasci]
MDFQFDFGKSHFLSSDFIKPANGSNSSFVSANSNPENKNDFSPTDYGTIFNDIVDEYLYESTLDKLNKYDRKISKTWSQPDSNNYRTINSKVKFNDDNDINRRSSWWNWKSMYHFFVPEHDKEDSSDIKQDQVPYRLRNVFKEEGDYDKSEKSIELPKRRVTIQEKCEIIYPSLNYESKRRSISRRFSFFKKHH